MSTEHALPPSTEKEAWLQLLTDVACSDVSDAVQRIEEQISRNPRRAALAMLYAFEMILTRRAS